MTKLDPESGKCTELKLAAEIENPSFFAVHPTQPLLFAGGEGDGGIGYMVSFRIEADGQLTEINRAACGPEWDRPCRHRHGKQSRHGHPIWPGHSRRGAFRRRR